MTAMTPPSVIGRDRDLHLLLPPRPASVLVVDSSDDAAESLRLAGHSVTVVRPDTHDWPSGHDVGVLLSPHRAATPIYELIGRLDAAVNPHGAIIVVDRPRWAWPDLVGRRDRISGRRWLHGAMSARRIRQAINRHRPVEAVCLLTPHDLRFRHLAPLVWRGRPCDRSAARLVLRELWVEAGLRLPVVASVLGRLPLAALIGSAPTLAWVAGAGSVDRTKLAEVSDGSAPAAFLGSSEEPTCTVVVDPETSSPRVFAVSADPRWSPGALVATAEALTAADVPDVSVATHRRHGDSVRIEWIEGRPPTEADTGAIAAALGRIHRTCAGPRTTAGSTTLAHGRTSLAEVISAARSVAPVDLRPVLDGLEDVATPTAWVHGDWGQRNVRLINKVIGVFDLDLADERGSAGFDVGWFLLHDPDVTASVVAAYEAAAQRSVTIDDLRLGLAGVLSRYGPEAGSAAWARVSNLGIEQRRAIGTVAGS
jgi:hypothetical protein